MHTRRAVVTLLVAGYAAAWAVNRSLVQVRGRSMEPALREGDRLLTRPARPADVIVGRVVVVADPADHRHLVIKRVAAVEHDAVTVLGDHAAASTDSRHWGPVPRDAIRRVVIRRWPDLRTRLHRTA